VSRRTAVGSGSPTRVGNRGTGSGGSKQFRNRAEPVEPKRPDWSGWSRDVIAFIAAHPLPVETPGGHAGHESSPHPNHTSPENVRPMTRFVQTLGA
jgi:hypothetical protein